MEEWPPPWLPRLELYVAICQWGLGSYERYLAGEGSQWLTGAVAAGDYLMDSQEQDLPVRRWMVPPSSIPPATLLLRPPWLSGIAQGQAASLLMRLHLATGDLRVASGALERAVRPLSVPTEKGGFGDVA